MKRIWEREMWIVLGFLAGCFALGMAGGILFANLAYIRIVCTDAD